MSQGCLRFGPIYDRLARAPKPHTLDMVGDHLAIDIQRDGPGGGAGLVGAETGVQDPGPHGPEEREVHVLHLGEGPLRITRRRGNTGGVG